MSYLDEKERQWRNKQTDIINYRDYVSFFPQDIQKLLKTNVPIAQHSKLPPKYVAKALSKSIRSSTSLDGEYFIEENIDSKILVLIKLFFEGNVEIIGVFSHLTKEKESVILVSSDESVSILAMIDEILEALRENFVRFLRSGGDDL